jgi:hypothetical protein
MKRHRMLLSLDDETYSLLKQLSRETGVPMATIVFNDLKKRNDMMRRSISFHQSNNMKVKQS